MRCNSVLSASWKTDVKNVIGIMNFLCIVFILPGEASAASVLQTAIIRASDDRVYQVRYDEDRNVENFPARSLDGEIPPRDIAAELYIATNILTALPFTPFDYKKAIDTIAEDTSNSHFEFAERLCRLELV